MLVVLAAATITMSFEPPALAHPEETDSKGYALMFSGENRERFTVFVKDPGVAWSQVPDVEESVQKPEKEWLVFHTALSNMDFILSAFEAKGSQVSAKVRRSDELDNYFDDANTVAGNNFGLHDIY